MSPDPLDALTSIDDRLGRVEEALAQQSGVTLSGATEESPHLQVEVPANTTEWTDVVTWTAPDDGMITGLLVWHVPNSEDALKTRPVRRTRNNRRKDIPNYPDDGETFITGEPDDRPYSVTEPIHEGEEIVVAAKNTNSNYAYRVAVIPTIDYSIQSGGGQ